ncbi:hypothetical protein ACIGKL_04890 [Pseudomonas sp. NPDC077186]|uniref:hypothetical protein n=1 Tax=Pseudomonas sp. NPDC077186 TaxID=3364421 RepID=UPI0037C53B0D
MLGLGALNTAPVNTLPALVGQAVTVPDSQVWRLRVQIGGEDVSARLTGVASIEFEESGSRLCTLRLLPEPGVFEPDAFTGQQVTFYHQRLEGDLVAAQALWFTGEAMQPSLDISSQVLTVTATCQRQRRLAAMTPEQIAALVPGDYAVGVFGEIDDPERYAADLLSTRALSLDCGADGQFRLTAWEAAPVAHYSFTADEIIDGSLQLKLATADQLLNRVELTVEYRYQRLRHREYTFAWEHPAGSFCVWLGDDTELPTLSMLTGALDQANWTTLGLTYEALPPSMPNPCGNGGSWGNRFTADPHLLAFNARVGARVAQTLTETYKLTLEVPGSVAAYGVRGGSARHADEVEFDGGAWEDEEGPRPETATQDELGDWIIDEDEPARRENLLRTAFAVERTRMHASHRLSRLAFQTPVTDEVFDLVHTAQVEALGMRARGKVVRGAVRWDHDSGEAVAELELALARVGQVAAGAGFTLPARPVFDFGEPPESIAQLATQLGGRPTSPEYDEDLDGFAGNYGWETPSSESHPRRLQITTPDIAAEHRDPAEATREQSYAVGLPGDLLLLEAA